MEKKISEINVPEIQDRLNGVNELMKPTGYQLAYISPVKDCIPLEKNAHYMDKPVFDKLVNNVAEDGFLSQLPFMMKQEDGKYLILSGNHRVKAAIKAKHPYILTLFVENISKDEQLSYQLSHNSLVGRDDMKMLKELFEQIESLDHKEFSGLNSMDFIDVEGVSVSQINDGDIELTEMKFLFVEDRAGDVTRLLQELEKQRLDEQSAIVYGNFEEFIKTMTAIKAKFGIKSNTVAFGRMIDICREYITSNGTEEQEECQNGVLQR